MADTLAASTLAGLSLTLRTDTQSETAYLDGRILGTVQRRSGFEPGAPMWRAYDRDGRLYASASAARLIVKHVQAWALIIRERGGFPPACTVELAPDCQRRPLTLAVVRHAAHSARKGFTLAGRSPGHVFLRLSYLGQPAPTFRRKRDLIEWLALVGMAEGEAVACVGGVA